MINRILAKFKWWCNQENKHCKSFCVLCPYFDRCVYDTQVERSLEMYHKAKCNLASLYGISVSEFEDMDE